VADSWIFLPARPALARGPAALRPSTFAAVSRQHCPPSGWGAAHVPAPYSPDLNPIEMAFAKLKAAARKLAAKSIKALIAGIAQALTTFAPQECTNFLAAAGYDRV
jgi:transposase